MARELAAGEARRVDYGTINGAPFHTLCGLGYFSRVAREREQTRSELPFGRLLSVALSTFRSFVSGGRMRITIHTEGTEREIDAYALMVTNNHVGADWRRARLDGGVLELHVMRDGSLMHRARAGFELLSGKWREGEMVETLTARRFEVKSVRSRLWTTVDGELRREQTPLAFDLVPGGLSLLMPKAAEAPPSAE
jgi:diacylglycerol kinase family enzyme